MRYFLASCLFQLLFQFCFAQEDGIGVSYIEDVNGNYKFYCQNDNYCTYTIVVNFLEIRNLSFKYSLPYQKEVDHGRNYLFTLEAGNPSSESGFNYEVAYIKGKINPNVDLHYNYLIPVAAGKPAETFELDYFQINEKDPAPKDYYAVGFKMEEGDTIFAARRGVVSAVRSTASLTHSGYAFSSDANFIEVFQNDGSFARYQVLKKALVELGQKVEAATPIAIAGGENYLTGIHVRFFVYYNFEDKNKKKNAGINNRLWAYVPLQFCTEEQQNQPLKSGYMYTGVHPDSLIIKEMSKREEKKWRREK